MAIGKRVYWIAALVAVLALAGAAVTLTSGLTSAGSGDDDRPIAGSALDEATAAALEHTGGGTVTETEAGDDGAAYSVEIRLDDGSQVEVNLDESFTVIGQEADDDGPNDEDGPGDAAGADIVIACSDPTGADDDTAEAKDAPDTDDIEEQCGPQDDQDGPGDAD